MSKSTAAARYAQALFELAVKNGQTDQIEEDLRTVREVFVKTPELTQILKSPKWSKTQKKQLISTSFSGISQHVLNTMYILVDRRRNNEMVELADEYINRALDARGTAVAHVSSATKLSDADKEAISASFAPKVGKQRLDIHNHVDSALLGGIRIRIGNRIFDGTLRNKLNRLERELKR
ncbi:F0F1 ATP synthase subunit delta [Jeotgalibacillus terrae]|uniref:ATP synthase subunit delta n=1 Tax=Jeotgalibacillus terrae TaxID=587735 RepID=A0ABW5ZBJ1_9BACL|nr:F0F1 ATP synthase subunit delta [Jeotgalibacillus terrae]MBM7577935.1 F-type H+-transporting ATPase subunit delta [Jeotgalibacillus terrae]